MRLFFTLSLLALTCSAQILDLGSRRELFVDHYLIDKMEGAELRLQVPQDRGPCLISTGLTKAFLAAIPPWSLFRMERAFVPIIVGCRN
jgi:hypothetical protein